VNEIYFHIDDGHSKIWGLDVFRGIDNHATTVLTYWGRIGVPMDRLQKKEKDFKSYYDAYDFAWEKIQEKIAKGYHAMPNSQYFQLVLDEKPVWQIINLMRCYKKEQLEKS